MAHDKTSTDICHKKTAKSEVTCFLLGQFKGQTIFLNI